MPTSSLPALPDHTRSVHLVDEAPVSITRLPDGVWQIDFGRVAFGNLQLTPPANTSGALRVHFGEAFHAGRIHRQPPGTVRYSVTEISFAAPAPIIAAPAPDARHRFDPDRRYTNEWANLVQRPVPTPAEWGVVTPFRWVEIEGWPGELTANLVRRRAAYPRTWDDHASAFRSSDPVLDGIWELCRYSIKATAFTGIYIDGDRERIAYEADAYLNQLSHLACDPDPTIARDTIDWLLHFPTWPSEWPPHLVLMAHADWMHTGDTAWLAGRFDALRSCLLEHRARPDGLVHSEERLRNRGDLVDWPVTERDGYVFTELNTVVNAFRTAALRRLADLAQALGRTADAAALTSTATRAHEAFLALLFDPSRGVFTDGLGTDHASSHANFFPLAFGLVPSAHRDTVIAHVLSRGMACSVYAAQYLLDALFEYRRDNAALDLILAPGDRSWRHMLASGTTITWEAWDQHYKPNQDWNHAWGAAPANLLPKHVLGARALTPGWRRIGIAPRPGSLLHAEGRVPTPHGPVTVAWKRTESTFELTLDLPAGTSASVSLPAPSGSRGVWRDDQAVPARLIDDHWHLTEDFAGPTRLQVR